MQQIASWLPSTGPLAGIVPALLVAAPLLVAAAAPRAGRRTAVAGATGSLAVAAVLALSGALAVVPGSATVFAAALAVVVVSFAERHLDGDVRRGRHRRALLVTSAASLVVLAAGDLALLAAGWVVAGAGLTALVGHHVGLGATRRAVRSLRTARAVGDLALVLACGLLVAATGTTSVPALAAAAPSASPVLLGLALAALLVAVAARSAQLPFSRWLPLSVVAPAPVSALAHAGIVNGPVVVLLALEPVWRGTGWFGPVLLAVGLATAVLTFVRLLVRADVKSRLAWSTTAQLGFMLVLVAVGAHAAALLHAALHGIYKADAFLRAGEDVSAARRDRLPAAPASARWSGAGLGAVVAVAVLALDGAAEQPLSAVAVLVAAVAGGAGLFSLRASVAVRVTAVVSAVVALGAVLALARLVAAGTGLPFAADGTGAWVAAAGVAALAATGAVLRARRPVRGWAFLHRLADPVVGLPEALHRRGSGPVAPLPAPDAASPSAQNVRRAVAEAAQALPPAWDWRAFVAANPLWGSRSRPFAEAVDAALAEPGAGAPDLVDDVVAGWVAAWTAPGGAPWPAPHRDLSLWDWFGSVAVADPVLGRLGREGLDADAVDVLRASLPSDDADAVAAARAELLALPGWSALLARRSTQAAAVDVDALVDLLAVRAVVRHALRAPARPAVPVAPAAAPSLLAGLEEREALARAAFAVQVAGRRPAPNSPAVRPEADLVLCIDVRSEPLRRHLEALGPFRTKGFAGFFGVPAARVGAAGESPRLPALLAPAVRADVDAPAADVADVLKAGLRAALDAPGGGFAAVDVASLRGLTGLLGAVRPVLRRRALRPAAAGTISSQDRPAALAAAVGAARAMGLGPASAPFVVLVGHGSTSTNNTAVSAFDCGACGGHRGGFNARLLADLLNAPDGRAALADAGLPLPDDTVVLAAEHDTGLDRVTLLGAADVPGLDRLRAALAEAGARTAAERLVALPSAAGGGDPLAAVARRCADPAQVRHEWGLAGNAFFVAAPRGLTRGLDLRGRAFLHEYDAAADPDGAGLEQILTAPLVVAHWINSQYLFSALDPWRWGSGSKTAHNPVGGLGVVLGPGGDLQVGLAEQSVRHDGAPPAPVVRLLAVVADTPERIDAVLDRHEDVAALVRGEWLALWSIDPRSGDLLRRAAHGWESVLVPARVSLDALPGPRSLAPVG